jgi:hypothetical protein
LRFRFKPKREKNRTEPDLQTLMPTLSHLGQPTPSLILLGGAYASQIFQLLACFARSHFHGAHQVR